MLGVLYNISVFQSWLVIIQIQIDSSGTQMEEQSQKTEFDHFKQKIFNFTYELVTNQISLGLYLSLIILQNLQFIGYYSNGSLVINTVGFNYFRQGVKFINLLQFLKDSNINVYLVPFFFILNIVHVVLFVVGYRAYQKRTQSLTRSISDRNFHKNKVEYFINLLMIGYTTVLTIPIFQTSVTSFYCSASNPFTNQQSCYVGAHIFIVILGVVNCLWLFLVNFYYAMYYFNRNPFSQGFMTCSSNWFNLGKFFVKIAPMIYMMYDPIFQFPVLFLVVMNIAYLGYLAVFSKFLFSFYRYNFKLEKINIGIEFFVCLFNIHFIVVYVFQEEHGQPNLLSIAWGAMSFLMSIIVVDIAERMKRSLLHEINSTQKKKLPQILEYLIYLINDTEAKFKQNKGIFYVSNIAKTHKLLCDNPKCYCKIYFSEQKKPGYNKKLWVFYTLLLAIIDRIIKNNKKAYPFFILKAYILFYKMQSEIKAATTISEVMSDKLDFSDDMLVKGLLFELNQQYSDTRDMQIYRKFNEHLLQQEEQSLVLTQLYMTYWEELIDQKSSIPKLQLILKKIKNSKQTIERVVDGALSIFHNHVRVLLLYKNLLKEVMNDYLGSIRCEQRYKIGLKENKLSNVDTVNKIQFRQNENLLVINLTRNYSNPNETMGKYKVISISSNVKEFLGFTNTQLKGESINKLIPRVYHSIHDEFIDNMLDRRNSEIQSKQIRIFPLTSNGCIIECNLISKFMPSINYGINIVSFMEQCDKEKDEFFIIYNSSTGIVDSMTIEAQMLLKDESFRNSNSDVLSMPDNINDLLPNWDYRQQTYRDRSKRGKSAKTIPQLNQSNLNVRNIELYRSDGIGNKFIKVLKFKSSFLTKMLSLQNQSYKQSNTIQKYLEHRREMTGMSEYDKVEKMDTSQIEGVIRFDTSRVLDREKERKKTMNSLMKIQNEKTITIDESPPQNYRLCFLGIQIALLLAAVCISSIQVYTLFNNVNNFDDDIGLIVSVNAIQSELADTTYVFSLTLTELAYTTTNVSLPYPHRSTSFVNTKSQLAKISNKFDLIDGLVKDANPLLIIKRENDELTADEISMQAIYRKSQLTSDTYTKLQTIVQVVYQYITYGQQILYTLNDLHETVQSILPSTNLYFIFVNSIQSFHKKMNTIKETLISDIESNLSKGVNVYMLVSLLNSIIFIVSAFITVLFYRYILDNYVLKVLAMYEQINLDKIKEYKDKCHRYKLALKGKDDKEKSSENIDKTLEIINETIGKQADNILIEHGSEEESKLLPQKMEEPEEKEEHFLSFQSKPGLKKIIGFLAIWTMIHGVLLIALLLSYKSQTSDLQTAVSTLQKYAQTQSSLVHLRFYSHFSLNLLSYWNDTKLAIINEEVQEYVRDTLINMNYTELNLTQQRSFISAKYHQFALIRQMVLAKNTTAIEAKLKAIISTFQQINDLLQFLYNQTLFYETVALGVSQSMSNHLNLEIIATILYIAAFWILGIRYVYLKILEQHQITYEMYNIIGYNLRKEIEAVK